MPCLSMTEATKRERRQDEAREYATAAEQGSGCAAEAMGKRRCLAEREAWAEVDSMEHPMPVIVPNQGVIYTCMLQENGPKPMARVVGVGKATKIDSW